MLSQKFLRPEYSKKCARNVQRAETLQTLGSNQSVKIALNLRIDRL